MQDTHRQPPSGLHPFEKTDWPCPQRVFLETRSVDDVTCNRSATVAGLHGLAHCPGSDDEKERGVSW
ncbi:MAG: hypothetical protein LBD01_07160 [Puniceicoccales bacterium]|jgi:hypothetical protein|nr:hypothetical protein [Puniceicoccales bacterium]